MPRASEEDDAIWLMQTQLLISQLANASGELTLNILFTMVHVQTELPQDAKQQRITVMHDQSVERNINMLNGSSIQGLRTGLKRGTVQQLSNPWMIWQATQNSIWINWPDPSHGLPNHDVLGPFDLPSRLLNNFENNTEMHPNSPK